MPGDFAIGFTLLKYLNKFVDSHSLSGICRRKEDVPGGGPLYLWRLARAEKGAPRMSFMSLRRKGSRKTSSEIDIL